MARKVVRYSWNDERVLRRAMTMPDRMGNPTGALPLTVHHEFAEHMRRELSATPSAETTALAATLRS